jgi:FkbM family methyltransferase
MTDRTKKLLKKVYLKITGKVNHLKKSIDCNSMWYGNHYGGFYICPDLLNKNSIVYSFGIGEDISFDKTILKNHSCKVFGFDPTPKSIDWIAQQNLPKSFSFIPIGIGTQTEITHFYLPLNDNYVSGSTVNHNNVTENRAVKVQMKSLRDIINELNHKYIDILKMDIEGSEYAVLENILNTDINIAQMLIEFHDRFFRDGVQKSKKIVKMMRKKGYEIFAVSDSFEEISFIKKGALNKIS